MRYGTKVVDKMTRSLVARSETTCKPGNDSAICAKPVSESSNTTLPIVLGAVYVWNLQISHVWMLTKIVAYP